MRKYTEAVSSAVTGLPVYLAEIRVLTSGISPVPAQLYSDNGITPLTQPALTDGLGSFEFFVADGTYSLVIADPGGANPRTFTGIEIYEDARNVSVPIGEAGVALPSVGARAGMALGFDNLGLPVPLPNDSAAVAADVARAEAAADAAVAAAEDIAFGAVYTTLAAALAGGTTGLFVRVMQSLLYQIDTYGKESSTTLSFGTGLSTDVGAGIVAQALIASSNDPAVIPQMPATPIISVYGIDGKFTDGMFVPSRLRPTPTPNMYQMLDQITAAGGATVTRGQPDPWGGNTAVRIQLPNTSAVVQITDIKSDVTPSEVGDYRVGFMAKSYAGAGAQTVPLRKGTGTPLYTLATTESAWSEMTGATFTGMVNNDTINLKTSSGSLDVVISPPMISPVQVRLPFPPVQATGGLVDNKLSIVGYVPMDTHGNIVMPVKGRMKFADDGVANLSFTAMTMIVCFKQTATATGFTALFFHKASSGSDLAMPTADNAFSFTMPGMAGSQINTTMTALGQGFVTLAVRFDATRSIASIGSIDYTDAAHNVGTGTGGTPYLVDQAFFGGGGYNDSAPFPGLLNNFHVYDRYLSDTELSQAVRHAEGNAVLFGNVLGHRNIWVADGDSITAGTGATNPATTGYAITGALAAGIAYFNVGVSGSTLTSLYDEPRFTNTKNKIIQGVRDGKRMIYSVMIGVNAIPLLTDVQTYINVFRNLGAKVVLCTVTSSGGQSDSVKNAYNAGLRGLVYDALADVAANANLGGNGAYANTTYFGDGLHPTQVGHDLISPIVRAAVQSLMV